MPVLEAMTTWSERAVGIMQTAGTSRIRPKFITSVDLATCASEQGGWKGAGPPRKSLVGQRLGSDLSPERTSGRSGWDRSESRMEGRGEGRSPLYPRVLKCKHRKHGCLLKAKEEGRPPAQKSLAPSPQAMSQDLKDIC